jgi:hypothetical protein
MQQMVTGALIPPAALANVTHINDARRLLSEFEAVSQAAAPVRLRNLIDAYELLIKPPPADDPLDVILADATAGGLDADRLAELVAEAARSKSTDEYRKQIAQRAAGTVLQRFSRELLAGGADELIDTVRPAFDTAAAAIDQALQAVDVSQDPAEFIETADPDALTAYQSLRGAVQVVETIVTLVVRSFGVRSITFPLIVRPVEGVDEFNLDDVAIWTSTPDHALSATRALREHSDAVASQRSINPQQMGMRTSRFMRGGLRLNTLAEAHEVVRQWAETSWANHESSRVMSNPDAVALPNPYAKVG